MTLTVEQDVKHPNFETLLLAGIYCFNWETDSNSVNSNSVQFLVNRINSNLKYLKDIWPDLLRQNKDF